MLRPITVAPTFASDSSTTALLALTSPPSRPCIDRQTFSGKTHSCRRMPPTPIGFFTLWLGPATKPSRDIEILKRSFDTSVLRARRGLPQRAAPVHSGVELRRRQMAIDPEKADLERFLAKDTGRPFVLVQLLRFAEGGRDKYLQYAAAVQPVTRSIGAQVLYAGECVEPLLAAPGQAWDAIVVVRYPSRAAYAKMHDDPAYGAVVHLRREALREAMLLPMDDWPGR